VLKRHPGRLPAGALLPIRGRGLPLCAGSGNATRVSPARAARCRCDRQVRETQRPAPDPAGGKRPPRAGRALAGGFGPRRDKDRPCAVAKAMAFANQAAKVQSPVRAGPGNATRVSPARARRCLVDRQVREGQRPAPDPAGGKRPPWAGRALAGGFGPRPVLIPAWRCGRGDGPCQRDRASRRTPLRAGTGNARRFPRPRGTVPCRSVGPGTTKGQRPTRRVRSARHGRVGRWPGAVAPGWPRGSVALWQGRWPLPLKRWHCFRQCGRGKRDPRFPRPRGTVPCRPAGPGVAAASARPGGREAPARGGSGAGRGALGPPAGQGPALRGGKGDGLCQSSGDGAITRPRGTVRLRPALHHHPVQSCRTCRSVLRRAGHCPPRVQPLPRSPNISYPVAVTAKVSSSFRNPRVGCSIVVSTDRTMPSSSGRAASTPS